MNPVLFKIALGIYGFAMLCNLAYLISLKGLLARAAGWLFSVGFGVHLGWLIARTYEAGHLPVTNLHESLSFFALAIIGVYLAILKKFKESVLGAFISPLALALMIIAASRSPALGPILPILRSYWLPVHTVFSFFGNALFALAFSAGAIYLVQERQVKKKKLGGVYHRLPSLEVLDEINYYCLTFGFPLLTLGIISGAIWAQNAWGSYWSWDPRQTWALITWALYAALLHGRLMSGWRGKRAAIFALFGFGVVIFSYFGVRLLLASQHVFN